MDCEHHVNRAALFTPLAQKIKRCERMIGAVRQPLLTGMHMFKTVPQRDIVLSNNKKLCFQIIFLAGTVYWHIG